MEYVGINQTQNVIDVVVGKLNSGDDYCLPVNLPGRTVTHTTMIIEKAANLLLDEVFRGQGVDPRRLRWFEYYPPGPGNIYDWAEQNSLGQKDAGHLQPL